MINDLFQNNPMIQLGLQINMLQSFVGGLEGKLREEALPYLEKLSLLVNSYSNSSEEEFLDDKLLTEGQIRQIIQKEFGFYGKILDTIISRFLVDSNNELYSLTGLGQVKESISNMRMVNFRDLQSNCNLPPAIIFNAMGTPVYDDMYIIHSPASWDMKIVTFVNNEVSSRNLVDRVNNFYEDSSKGHYSFKDVVKFLKFAGLSPFSNQYVSIARGCLRTTPGKAFEKDSTDDFFKDLEQYNFMNAHQFGDVLSFIKQEGIEKIQDLVGEGIVKLQGTSVYVIRKDKTGREVLKNIKEEIFRTNQTQNRFGLEVSLDTITLGEQTHQIQDEIALNSVLDMLTPKIGKSGILRERLTKILPDYLPTTNVLAQILPILSTHYLFDERITHLRRNTCLSKPQIVGRMYHRWDKSQWEHIGVKSLYESEQGKILMYPINKESSLIRALEN